MKLNKQELIKALEIVKPGLANKEMIEQSTSFAFMDGRVVTYNDEISISHPVKHLDITGAVKADKLYGFLNKVKKDEIDFEITESEIELTAGKSRAGLVLQNEIKLPLEELGGIGKWKPVPDGLAEAIEFAVFSCSNDMSKPILTCVHVRKELDRTESSNGYRATHRKFEGALPVPSFLIPSSSARALGSYPITHIARGAGWVHFKTKNDTVFSCRVFADNFPEISHLFEFDGDEITLPKTIGDILDRAGVFKSQDRFVDDMVEVKLANKKITIRVERDSDWFEEEANIRYSDIPISFQIQTNFLKEICARTQKCIISEKMLKFKGDNWEHILALTASE